MHTLSFSQILYGFINFSRIHFELISLSRHHYGSIIFCECTLNILSLTRIHSQTINFFAYSLRINYPYRQLTMSPLIFSRILYVFFLIFRVFTLNSLLFREFTRDSLFFRDFTMASLIYRVLNLNLLFLSRIHSQSIIFFANEFTIFSWTHYESINFFAYSLWIHYLFRVYTMDPLSSSPIRYTICIANYTIFTLYDEIITW